MSSSVYSDQQERGKAFAMFGAVMGGGSGVGLVLGGVLTEYLSWHWVFYVNIPLALAAAAGAVFVLQESRCRERAHFDVLGAVLATAGLVALVYGLGTGGASGWGDPLTIGTLAAGLGLLLLFVVAQARTSRPPHT